MDALDFLERQHRDVRELLDRIAAETRCGPREVLVARLAGLIDAHARSEERHFDPACVAVMNGDRERLYAAGEARSAARNLALGLLRTCASDVRFEARLGLVRDLFLRHAHEEEDGVFPTVKRSLTDEQLDAIGGALERSFERIVEISGARRRALAATGRSAGVKPERARRTRPRNAEPTRARSTRRARSPRP